MQTPLVLTKMLTAQLEHVVSLACHQEGSAGLPKESLHPCSLRLCLHSLLNPIPGCSHKPDWSQELSSPAPQDASKPPWQGWLLQ